MPKAAPFISSSNSGEFSPRMDARVDFEKYASGISRGLNLICLPQGGVTKRPGTRFVKEVKNSAAVGAILIPFEPSSSRSYVIEAGDLYFRIYRNQAALVSGGSPVEVATPYAIADLASLRWAGNNDVMYLFHDNYAPRKLSRLSDTSWTLATVAFQDGPWLDINPGTDLEATNLIDNSRFDGGLSSWTQAVTGDGYVNYDGTSRVVLFQASANAASTGKISQLVTTPNPNDIHVLHFQIVGGGTVTAAVGTTDGGTEISAPGALSAGWYSISFTPGQTTFYVAFSASNAFSVIAGGVSAAFCYTVNANLIQPSGASGTVTVTTPGTFAPFLPTDIGRQIRFEYPGREPVWGTIATFSSGRKVSVTLNRKLLSTAPLETWRLGAWSQTTGYPHVGTFYQQRLFVGRTATQPQTLWASQSSDFENMRPDSWVEGAQAIQDDDALNFTLASRQVSPIVWMNGSRRFVVGTTTGQWLISSSKGAALTPSDFGAENQTSVSAQDIASEQIDLVGIFAGRGMRKIYDLAHNWQVDSLTASDVTILSEHITDGNIAQIVYQQEPWSLIWVRLANGKLACMTYKRNQNVTGWTPVELAGTANGAASVEAMAVIPGSADTGQVYSSINRDEVWMIVKRVVGSGTVKRYIEVMEGFYDGPNRAAYTNRDTYAEDVKAAQVNAFYVDCGLSYIGSATTAISGLSHLENEMVTVLADGAVQQSKRVVGGAITLDQAASTVHVGLAYDWMYRSLKLPFGSPTGPGVTQTKKPYIMAMVLRDSAAFSYAIDLLGDGDEVNGELTFDPVSFRTPGDDMNEATPLFTGETLVDVGAVGVNTDIRLVMRGDSAPLPWTLLGFSPRLEEAEL